MTPTEITFRLAAEVLDPMKRTFVGKDEIIDLLGICLVGRRKPVYPGSARHRQERARPQLAGRLQGKTFEYLLTRFTEPNELFGPFDIRKLREGELLTNTEGMLPEASLVFLDELLNANSAILNSLLMALNERVFRRGKETRPLAALMFVGASNRLPEDDALQALFDRFLLRVRATMSPGERLADVLDSRLEARGPPRPSPRCIFDRIDVKLQQSLPTIDLAAVRQPLRNWSIASGMRALPCRTAAR